MTMERKGVQVEMPPGISLVMARVALVAPFLLWVVIVAGAFLGRTPTTPIELETLATAWHMYWNDSWLPVRGATLAPTLPPLYYWFIESSWLLLGASDIWPRLIAALSALLSLILIGQTARVLWPHHKTAALFARILLVGIGGYVVSATLVQPETLALPIGLLGFLLLAKLYNGGQDSVKKAAFWAVLALLIALHLMLIGWSALLFLPLLALLMPLIARDRTDYRVTAGWYWGAALSPLPGLIVMAVWFYLLPEAKAENLPAFFWSFGNGWLDPATEATRREPWSLLLLPIMLYPWIFWRTLWRAAKWQHQQKYGPRFQLCLLYLAIAASASFAGGYQLQGQLPVLCPLSLLGARLLATQEIKPRDFHAVIPAFLALLVGLVFFLMNIVPTAHLDAVWREFFGSSLPIWLGGIGLASGLVLLVAGYILAQLSPSQQIARTLQVTCLPILLITCLNIEFPFSLRQFFDLTPVGKRLHDLEAAGQPIAVYGRYRGEFDFPGRLETAPTVLADPASAILWAHNHPDGVILTYFDGSPIRLPALPYFRGAARDRWVAIWPTSAVTATDSRVLKERF